MSRSAARSKKRKKPTRAAASTAAGRSRAASRNGRSGHGSRNGRPKATAGKRGAASKRGAAKRKPAPKRAAKATAKRTRNPVRRTAGRKPAKRRTRRRLGLPSLSRLVPGRTAARRRILLAIAVPAALAAAYFGWLRDSPLVAVRDVEVVGVSGSQKQRIEKELSKAAEDMTTLHVREDALLAAAAAFPDVASVSADPSFPSGLEITVVQRPPVLLAQSRGQTVAVAGDGAVLPGLDLPKGAKLPSIEVSSLPKSGRLAGEDLEQALIAGAAPEPLRPLIEKVAYEKDEGVLITLQGGLPAHFGTGARAEAKWEALAAILADPKLKRVTYVDVRVPERAAAGGAAPPPPAEEVPPEPTNPAVVPVEPEAAAEPVPAPVTEEPVAP
jgi:cell division protein FtsQ